MMVIFIFIILVCILKLFLIGVVLIIGFIILVLIKILDMKNVFFGFSESSIWFIVMVFFIFRGFIKMGLGFRIVY